MRKRHVVIVGGGAAGMMAAIAAARCGALVTVIEQKDQLGKKILSTGNGKCNLSNTDMDASCFRGDATEIMDSVLSQFGVKETISLFEELGIWIKNRQGYLYPFTEQAATVRDLLKMELESRNVKVLLNKSVSIVKRTKYAFEILLADGKLTADAVILATGGMAAKALGSDGSGYQIAKSLGHSIIPVVPALVKVLGAGRFFKKVAGVRMKAKVSVNINGVFLHSDTGELQWTSDGISGIPVFQVSRYIGKALYNKERVFVELDLLPDFTEERWETLLRKRLEYLGNRTASDFLTGIFPTKMIPLLLKASGIDENTTFSSLEKEKQIRLQQLCKHFRIEISAVNTFDQAQVCAGGVNTAEIYSHSMESKLVEELYFAGELLDIDGKCGGYNLQWAWSTGYIAGTHAAKGKRK